MGEVFIRRWNNRPRNGSLELFWTSLFKKQNQSAVTEAMGTIFHRSKPTCNFSVKQIEEPPGFESIEWWNSQAEGPTSRWGSSCERSSFGSWFSAFVFRNVLGTVPECVSICGFKKNSSNADKMRDSVLLNSWDSFKVTLPSISLETCVIYSSILGTYVFRDWPFLGFSSCVSLATAANFRLFFNVAILWRENATQLSRLKYFLFVNQLEIITKNVILQNKQIVAISTLNW